MLAMSWKGNRNGPFLKCFKPENVHTGVFPSQGSAKTHARPAQEVWCSISQGTEDVTFIPHRNARGAKGSCFPWMAHLMVIKVPEHKSGAGMAVPWLTIYLVAYVRAGGAQPHLKVAGHVGH